MIRLHAHVEAALPYPGQPDARPAWCYLTDAALFGADSDLRILDGLFGIEGPVAPHPLVVPAAPARGLPDDASGTVYTEHLAWRPQDTFGESWITADELAKADWPYMAPFPSGWAALRRILFELGTLHGGDRVRMVTWCTRTDEAQR